MLISSPPWHEGGAVCVVRWECCGRRLGARLFPATYVCMNLYELSARP